MNDPWLTVVIPTIGRDTLNRTVSSACQDGVGEVIVVHDGPCSHEMKHHYRNIGDVKFHELGRKFGQYGWAATNVGYSLAKYDWIQRLDDDDILIAGAVEGMRKRIESDPSIECWIPGLLYSDGTRACGSTGSLKFGNVCHATFHWKVLQAVQCKPGRTTTDSLGNEVKEGLDFRHVSDAHDLGFKVAWYDFDVFSVRPTLPGKGGRGK